MYIYNIIIKLNYLFKVSLRINPENFEVVGVLSNGAFASTSPHTAAKGLPCKDILAIYREGYCEINLLAHFHRIYHARNFYLELDDENFNLFTSYVTEKNLWFNIILHGIYFRIIFFYTELSYRVDKTCTIDYARTITESAWKDYLKDCVGYENYIVANNKIFISNTIPQIISFTEHIDKSWHEIRGIIKSNPKVHYITEYILCTATSIC